MRPRAQRSPQEDGGAKGRGLLVTMVLCPSTGWSVLGSKTGLSPGCFRDSLVLPRPGREGISYSWGWRSREGDPLAAGGG